MGPLNFFLFFIPIPALEAALAGTFFWKPRVGLDLTVPTTESREPSEENIRNGIEVIIQGYQMGITLLAVGVGLDERKPYIYLDPTRAPFYTNAYRWALRYLTMLPPWLAGNSSYSVTHRVWNKRYLSKETFIPKWMRHLFPYVSEDDWEEEKRQYKLFLTGGSKFVRHFRFPSKRFNNYTSQETKESEQTSSSSS